MKLYVNPMTVLQLPSPGAGRNVGKICLIARIIVEYSHTSLDIQSFWDVLISLSKRKYNLQFHFTEMYLESSDLSCKMGQSSRRTRKMTKNNLTFDIVLVDVDYDWGQTVLLLYNFQESFSTL